MQDGNAVGMEQVYYIKKVKREYTHIYKLNKWNYGSSSYALELTFFFFFFFIVGKLFVFNRGHGGVTHLPVYREPGIGDDAVSRMGCAPAWNKVAKGAFFIVKWAISENPPGMYWSRGLRNLYIAQISLAICTDGV